MTVKFAAGDVTTTAESGDELIIFADGRVEDIAPRRGIGRSAERGFQVCDQVPDVLDPDREPHQRIADAELRARLGRH